MPEQSKRTPSDIVRDVTQQETFRFSPQLSPGRRARGPEIPLDISNDSAQIAEGLGILGDIAGAAAQVSGEFDERKARELTQEGSFAAIRAGTELDAFKGEVAANPLAFTPDDIRARQEEIYNRALAGKNEDFRNGFLPQAVRDQATFDRKVQALQQEAHTEQRISDTMMTMNDRFDSLIEEATELDKDQVLGIFTDQEVLDQFNLGVGTNRAEIARLSRNMLNEAQELNPRIPKKEFSRAFVVAAARKAVALGAPELLDFASVPGPDGISIEATELGDLVLQKRQEATRKKLSNKTDIMEHKEKVRKEAAIDTFNFLSDQIDIIADASTATEIPEEQWSATKTVILDQLESLRNLDPSMSDKVNKSIDFVHELNRDIPVKSDTATVAFLMQKAVDGTGTVDLVTSFFPHLTLKDRTDLQKRMPDWGGAKDPIFDNDDLIKSKQRSFNIFNSKTSLDLPVYRDAEVIKAEANDLYMRKIIEWEKRNSGETIPADFLDAITKDIINQFDAFKTDSTGASTQREPKKPGSTGDELQPALSPKDNLGKKIGDFFGTKEK